MEGPLWRLGQHGGPPPPSGCEAGDLFSAGCGTGTLVALAGIRFAVTSQTRATDTVEDLTDTVTPAKGLDD